jgi:hypothetical protein
MVASDRIIWHIPDQMSDEEIQAEPVFDDFILAKRAEASAVQMAPFKWKSDAPPGDSKSGLTKVPFRAPAPVAPGAGVPLPNK